jgi:hypothetical protein
MSIQKSVPDNSMTPEVACTKPEAVCTLDVTGDLKQSDTRSTTWNSMYTGHSMYMEITYTAWWQSTSSSMHTGGSRTPEACQDTVTSMYTWVCMLKVQITQYCHVSELGKLQYFRFCEWSSRNCDCVRDEDCSPEGGTHSFCLKQGKAQCVIAMLFMCSWFAQGSSGLQDTRSIKTPELKAACTLEVVSIIIHFCMLLELFCYIGGNSTNHPDELLEYLHPRDGASCTISGSTITIIRIFNIYHHTLI